MSVNNTSVIIIQENKIVSFVKDYTEHYLLETNDNFIK